MIGALGALALLLQTNVTVPTTPRPPAKLPFHVGETLSYSAKLSIWNAGAATLSVDGIDTVRGVPSWRFRFTTRFSVPMMHSNSSFTSWTGIRDFISRRFLKENDDNGKEHRDDHLIYPDSGFFRDNDYPVTVPTPATPLDDVAFFYFIRYATLEVGKTYTFENYFNRTKGPAIVKVLKRERKKLPDGRQVQCLVLNPVVDDPPHGMFQKNANARIWITDDERRLPVQIQGNSELGFRVTLTLDSIAEGKRPGQ